MQHLATSCGGGAARLEISVPATDKSPLVYPTFEKSITRNARPTATLQNNSCHGNMIAVWTVIWVKAELCDRPGHSTVYSLVEEGDGVREVSKDPFHAACKHFS